MSEPRSTGERSGTIALIKICVGCGLGACLTVEAETFDDVGHRRHGERAAICELGMDIRQEREELR